MENQIGGFHPSLGVLLLPEAMPELLDGDTCGDTVPCSPAMDAHLLLVGAAHQAGDWKPGIHGQNSRSPGVVATISCCPHLGRAASSEPPPCCDRLMGHSDVGRSWHSVGTHSNAAPSEVAARPKPTRSHGKIPRLLPLRLELLSPVMS